MFTKRAIRGSIGQETIRLQKIFADHDKRQASRAHGLELLMPVKGRTKEESEMLSVIRPLLSKLSQGNK